MALKRKIESKTSENTKTSKLELTEAKKKALTKNELLVKFNDLVKVNEDLIKVHNDDLKRIDHLEKTVALLQKQKPTTDIEKVEVEAQTDDSETCNECEFPVRDIWELGEHIYEFHTLKTYGEFVCTFCNERFGRKRDLMVHRKIDHEEKVGKCRSFSSGNCIYGTNECWWRHERNLELRDSEHSCGVCDENFNDRSKLMLHRKNKHTETVRACSHAMNGSCHFGSNKCWFLHEDLSTINTNEKSEKLDKSDKEVMEKMFDMMEKFSERIVQLENII
jgi:hypothetical protein